MGENVKVRTKNLARAMFQECVAAIIRERHWHKEQVMEAAGSLDSVAKEEERSLSSSAPL
jgi:hypothetical protein